MTLALSDSFLNQIPPWQNLFHGQQPCALFSPEITKLEITTVNTEQIFVFKEPSQLSFQRLFFHCDIVGRRYMAPIFLSFQTS
jgi:hypothetical protein